MVMLAENNKNIKRAYKVLKAASRMPRKGRLMKRDKLF